MKSVRPIAGIVALATAILGIGEQVAAKRLTLYVSPMRIDQQSKTLTVRVDTLFIEGGKGRVDGDSTFVQCGRSQDALPWMTAFARGDSLLLSWKQVRGASRNLMVAGGKPQEVELAVPTDGISRTCTCSGKRDTRAVRFAATVSLPSGMSSTSIQLTGKRLGFFERLLILRKGKEVQPPRQLIVCIDTESATTQRLGGEHSRLPSGTDGNR